MRSYPVVVVGVVVVWIFLRNCCWYRAEEARYGADNESSVQVAAESEWTMAKDDASRVS